MITQQRPEFILLRNYQQIDVTINKQLHYLGNIETFGHVLHTFGDIMDDTIMNPQLDANSISDLLNQKICIWLRRVFKCCHVIGAHQTFDNIMMVLETDISINNDGGLSEAHKFMIELLKETYHSKSKQIVMK